MISCLSELVYAKASIYNERKFCGHYWTIQALHFTQTRIEHVKIDDCILVYISLGPKPFDIKTKYLLQLTNEEY